MRLIAEILVGGEVGFDPYIGDSFAFSYYSYMSGEGEKRDDAKDPSDILKQNKC